MTFRHDLARLLRAVADRLDPPPVFAAIVIDLRDAIESERAELAAFVAGIARDN